VIDLHCHSTASDGTDSPAELVRQAVRAGVETMALTDHDTTAGWLAAGQAVAGLDCEFTLIPGAEFSCVYRRTGQRPISLHLLGYLFDPEATGLRAERARLRASRSDRGRAIVDNLNAAGYPVTWEVVQDIAAGGAVGRPHIGRALVAAGVVASVDEAFAEVLANDSPYYVAKADTDVLTAIELIRQAGGVAVIAHPWARRRGRVIDEAALAELAGAGLAGIEVDHLDHDRADRLRLREIVGELGLFATGSSDYHGANKSVQLGAETTDPQSLQQILHMASGTLPVYSAAARRD